MEPWLLDACREVRLKLALLVSSEYSKHKPDWTGEFMDGEGTRLFVVALFGELEFSGFHQVNDGYFCSLVAV